jgi:hypothetical protein
MVMSQSMSILTSHQSTEWYTPVWLIDLVKETLGEIDLDPASDPLPQSWIQAETIYTVCQDGLSVHWFGRVFLNPPYSKTNGKSNSEIWSTKLVEEYLTGNVEEAILLVGSKPGYKWWEQLFREWPVCMLRDRISFIKPDGSKGGQAKFGHSLFYMGPDAQRFRHNFSPYGRVIMPEK